MRVSVFLLQCCKQTYSRYKTDPTQQVGDSEFIGTSFFLLTELHPTRCEQSPRSDTTPPIHMRVGTRSSNCRCKGPQGVTPGTRPRLRPPASDSVDCTLYTTPTEDFSSCTRAHADARKPCAQPRTQFGNPKHPNREPGPIPGGWAGPTSPPSDETPAGRV